MTLNRLATFALAIAVLASGVQARSIGGTEVASEAALEKLKANKGVTLQWLWGAKPGLLTITEQAQGVAVSGGQGPHNGDELSIDGIVTRIEAKTFWFNGQITIVDNETSQPCVRSGTFTFRIVGARRFWRMKEQEARCPGRADLTDYVDIKF